MDFNMVVLSGNLTRDAEASYSQSGSCILKFGIAVNESRKTQNGDWENVPNFFDCTMFGTRAEKIKDMLSKGTRVHVSGKLHFSQWEAHDGSKRSKVDVTVNDIDIMRKTKDANVINAEKELGVKFEPYEQENIPF